MRRTHPLWIAKFLGKGLVYLTALVLILVGIVIAVVETGWAKNQIRALIVRQANEYLSATLEIGRLEGSLLRGIQLGDIRLSRDNVPIITIDEISLSYSLRELWQNGTVIRRIRLVRPSFAFAKQADGRWNISALLRREARQARNTGPGRSIELQSIEIVDGRVTLADPLIFGAAHVPTRFETLNTSFSFRYQPVSWALNFVNASWSGHAPDLAMTKISGGLTDGPAGWGFNSFSVETPTSAFVLDGRVIRDVSPSSLDLAVRADRFAFQEWGGIIHGLDHIAVTATFNTRLQGPLNRLATDIKLAGSGGSVNGRLVLDTTVDGWHGTGALDVGRIDLAHWLNRADRPSDITGRVTFNLDLDLGHHFPRGTYAFDGAHASYLDYGADHVRAHGVLTATEVQIADATATAYDAGTTATTGSTIGLDEPFPFRFRGTITSIDLRRLPKQVPVPHVESRLTFDYDVTGQFSEPFITGGATFAPSVFLGVSVGAGTVGTIDTATTPLRYGGEGDLSSIDLNRLGAGLDVAWMQDPRYAGVIAGHFRVQSAGSDRATLVLTGGGRIARASLFHGTITDADVRMDLDHGSLKTSFNGRFDGIDPAVALASPRLAATMNGAANVRTNVRDLLAETIPLSDYDIEGTLDLQRSTLHGIPLDTAHVDGALRQNIGHFTEVSVAGQALAGRGSGTVAFDEDGASAFDYDISRADLAQFKAQSGYDATGVLTTKGRLSGPYRALQFAGDARLTQAAMSGASALEASGKYTVTIPAGVVDRATGRLDLSASFLTIAGQSIQHAQGVLTMAAERVGFDVRLQSGQGRETSLTGEAQLHAADRNVQLQTLAIGFGGSPWRLAISGTPPAIRWTADGVHVDPVRFISDSAGDQRLDISGDWRGDGGGSLHVVASQVSLDSLEGAFERPARYGGMLDMDATIRGTASRPMVSGTVTITNGRVRRVSYEKLAGRIDYADGRFALDLRLDQAPGVWLTAKGTLPRSLLDRSSADDPIDVAIQSSPINLGLLDGLTDIVSRSTGTVRVDVKAIGTARDPHFDGFLECADIGFLVAATGSRYKNGHAVLRFARERVDVDALHLEDANGHPIDVKGSLATHELSVGDLQIDMTGQHFEVVHNDFGRVSINAKLALRGRFDAPRIAGDLTIDGGDVRVDRILERALFQPYGTEPAAITDVDAVAALNPWERLGLDISLHVPNTMKLSGDNVQVSPGTPIGLGNIKLRVAGDLYLYKDPGSPLSVTGSFDTVSGTYGFQGRQFDVDQSSSITFRGDLNPELYVGVTRLISGVDTRVTISGPLRQPELRLSSTPPLDSSDILSLIVFNVTPNQLSASQQQELAVRAGTLAAGFIATPIISALQNELGLDVLEVDPTGDLISAGPKVTVGEEIAPGLVARFSRQFGSEPYDEATIEYYISKILRLRATFSDAQSLEARSPFRRLERAGIDLLFFFSF